MVCFRREIAALTSENHSLERQLLNFQKPISPANNTISPNLAGRINIGQRSSSDAYLHDSLRSFASNQSSHQSQSLTHQSMISPHYHHHHPLGLHFATSFPWAAAARGKPRRGLMRRAVFSDAQRQGLEKRFQIQKYISKPDRKKLAEKLGLKDSQVS